MGSDVLKEEEEPILTCEFLNDDDGDDGAWCCQDFRPCDNERRKKCSCSKQVER